MGGDFQKMQHVHVDMLLLLLCRAILQFLVRPEYEIKTNNYPGKKKKDQQLSLFSEKGKKREDKQYYHKMKALVLVLLTNQSIRRLY